MPNPLISLIPALLATSALALGPGVPNLKGPSDVGVKGSAHATASPHRLASTWTLQDTLRLVYFQGYRRAGQLTVVEEDSLHRSYRFTSRDRGTTSELTSALTLDRTGIPIAISTRSETRGNLPSGIPETFLRKGFRASWSNRYESRDTLVVEDSFFLGIDRAHELGLLVRALLNRPDRELAVLPYGSASIRTVEERRFQVEGRSIDATLYAIDGIAVDPVHIWLDDDRNTFAEIGRFASGSLVREGWEELLPDLRAISRAHAVARGERQAQALGRRPAGDLVVIGARVFGAESQAPPDDAESTVVVRGSRFTFVGPRAGWSPVGATDTIDARGLTLIPGLWEMHGHVDWEGLGIASLAQGVTTLRDLGNDPDDLTDWRDRIAVGRAVGPRVIARGLLDGSGTDRAPGGFFVRSVAEVEREIVRMKELGFTGVKIYSGLPSELLEPAVRMARSLDLTIGGHPLWSNPMTTLPMPGAAAIRSGYTELQHLFPMIMLGLLDLEGVSDLASAVVQQLGSMNIDQPSVSEFVAAGVEAGLAIDATLTIGLGDRSWASDLDRYPPLTRQVVTGWVAQPQPPLPPDLDFGGTALRLVRQFHTAGLPLLVGTDFTVGAVLLEEMRLLVEAGLAPAEVLMLATEGAAAREGLEEELGTIAVGRLADFILVEGDPMHDISALENIRLVVKDGVIYDPAELWRELGVRPRE